MFIISVIPISNIPRQDILTYFYKQDIPLGSLVAVPYNTNSIHAIVVSSESVQSLKGTIKKEVFQLKKVETIITESVVSIDIVEALCAYAQSYFVPLSKIFYDIFPKWYWQETSPVLVHTNPKKIKKVFLENTFTERQKVYETYMDQNTTIWICVPSIFQVKKYEAFLKKNNTHVWAFTSTMSPAKQVRQYKTLSTARKDSDTEPWIIISTPFYAGLFLSQVDVCIFDQYGDDGYLISPPYRYDTRILCEYINSYTKNHHTTSPKTHIYGDDILPLSLTTKHNHALLAPRYTLYTKETKRNSEIFIHPVMETVFEQDIANKKKIAVVTLAHHSNQKILCNDCKSIVCCPKCHSEVTLVHKKTGSFFTCLFCLHTQNAHQKCAVCQSWNLHALGINLSTIQTYVKKKYPSNEIQYFTFAEINTTTTSIFDHIYIISVDGLMYSSDYTASEKIYRLIKKIEPLTEKISIQTAFPAPNILNTFKTLSFEEWITQEYSTRKKNLFPPFGTCYTIRAKNKKGLSVLNMIQNMVEKKGIRHIRKSTQILFYINSQYEETLDHYLLKKVTPDVIMSKEKRLNSERLERV